MLLTVTDTYESLREQYGPIVKLHTVRRAVTKLIDENRIEKNVKGTARLLTATDVKTVIQLLRDTGKIAETTSI